MASDVKHPPDKLAKKFYKCHPKQAVTTVICVICENAYHRSDFEKNKNAKYVGENLVVCPEHTLTDLTSNNEEHMLSDAAKKVIASIKLKQSEEIREELLKEIHNKTAEKHNVTVNSDDGSDLELLIAENTLLKKLVTELQDKNQVQKELIELQRVKHTESYPMKKTYAETITAMKPITKKVPKITVKATNPNQKNSLELLTKCLVSEKSIQTKFIRKKNDNAIEISCMNSTSLETAKTVISNKLKNYKIEVEQQGNPKIKIVGINNITSMDEDEIEDDINSRNFNHLNSTAKLLHMFTNKRNKTDTVLMEVTPEIYKYLRENKGVFIGHQRCRVYDLINITPCYNCARYGHSATKCDNDSVCIKCAEKHNVSECKHEKIECANCVFNNNEYKTSLDTNHLSTDRIKCTILRKKVKKYIDSINYPVAPVLPTWNEADALKMICNMQSNKIIYQRKTKSAKSTTKEGTDTTTYAAHRGSVQKATSARQESIEI